MHHESQRSNVLATAQLYYVDGTPPEPPLRPTVALEIDLHWPVGNGIDESSLRASHQDLPLTGPYQAAEILSPFRPPSI